MKKILILVGKKTDKKNVFLKLITDFTESDTDVEMDTFPNLTFEIENGRVEVRISGRDIREFDVVYIRSLRKDLTFMAGILSYSLDNLGVKYFDKKFKTTLATSDKLTSIVLLGLSGLPIIPTFYCEREKILENANFLIKKFGFPIIAKELMSHHSKNVFVLRSKEDFKMLDGHQFLFQKFIPLSDEYRFLVLGNEVKSIQRMYRDLSGIKAQVDNRYDYKYINVSEMSGQMKELAVKCAEGLNLQVAGVDLLVAKNKSDIYVIEVNGNPGFTYDTNVSGEIPELAKFLELEANK